MAERIGSLAAGGSAWGAALALAATALLLGVLGADWAAAQEQPWVALEESKGNYRATIYVLPSEPRVGQVNFRIRLVRAEDGGRIPDARVQMVAHDAEGAPTYQTRALNRLTAPSDYIGNFNFKKPGEWSVRVEARTEALGVETFDARIPILPAAVEGSTAAGWVTLGVFLLLFLMALFVWLSSRRALARRAEASAATD